MSLILESKDGSKFPITREEGMVSVLIREIVEEDENEEEKTIPIMLVDGNILEIIVEFIKYYNQNPLEDIQKPLVSDNMDENVNDIWYSQYINKYELEQIFELVNGANYMDIKPLLNLCCAKIASIIKGNTPEDIRRIFKIENEFTQKEMNAVNAVSEG